ncbi:protealysin inhibitor emfourin [Streptomyces sp. NPDC020858]|uniref:protealysin inhibitor emfourin n=1 Tax=Streptomyces sp. NPDC020858 TaxID=3365097 RepID=UPI0037B09A46
MTLATRGGPAVVVDLRLPPRALDTDTLPANAAAEPARLVAAVPTPEVDQPSGARDAMSYTITVEDGDRSTVLKQSDAAMTRAMVHEVVTRWVGGARPGCTGARGEGQTMPSAISACSLAFP